MKISNVWLAEHDVTISMAIARVAIGITAIFLFPFILLIGFVYLVGMMILDLFKEQRRACQHSED